MSTAMAVNGAPLASQLESALLVGDLATFTPEQRVKYYQAVCQSVGLNPLTRPFDYLELDGGGQGQGKKLVLYAKRDATDQLRKIHGVSVTITDRRMDNGVYIVQAKARSGDGREDESTGAVPVEKENGEWKTANSGKRYFAGNGTFTQLRGDALANALMKAETKAKRRVTLSICGLGLLDETELETIHGARVLNDHQEPTDPPKALPAANANGNGHKPAEAAKPAEAQTVARLTMAFAQCKTEVDFLRVCDDVKAANLANGDLETVRARARETLDRLKPNAVTVPPQREPGDEPPDEFDDGP